MRIFKRLGVAVAALIITLTCLPFTAFAADTDGGSWVGAWSTSPVETVIELNGKKRADFLLYQTVRVVIKPTIDGEEFRLHFTNKYGTEPLILKEVTVAEKADGTDCDIVTSTLAEVTFGGSGSVTIPVGEERCSDAICYPITALNELAVSYYVPGFTEIRTSGLVGGDTHICAGNSVRSEGFEGSGHLTVNINGLTMNTIPFFTGLDAYAKDAYSVVIIGDSTLCNQIPTLLAEKFVASGIRNIGVLQQAIMGNRLLYDGVGTVGNLYGEALLERFDADALSQAGVKKVFVKIGLNDILHPRTQSMKGKAPFATSDEIIAGYEELVRRAHAKGIEIYFFEKSPWKGYTREMLTNGAPDLIWSEEAEIECDTLNYWIRTNTVADGYIPLETLQSDTDSFSLKDKYSIDGIHFTKDAQVEVVDAIPVSYFGLTDSQVKSLSAVLASTASDGATDEITPPETPPVQEETAVLTQPLPSSEPKKPVVQGVTVPAESNIGNTDVVLSDTGEQSEAEAAAPEVSLTAAQNDKLDFSLLWLILAITAVIVIAAAAVYLIIRRKGKKHGQKSRQ